MKRLKIVLCSFAILAVFTSLLRAEIFGIGYLGPNGLSTLYHIDPTDGAAAIIGPVGFERCGGMDFDSEGVLFATCERADGSDTAVLVTIDPSSGAGTEIGPTGINPTISDISFRNSDGALYAYDGISDPEHTVYTLNPATGLAALVGNTGLSGASGNAMTFTRSDNLVHSQSSGGILRLYLINQSSGQATFIKELTVIDAPPPQVNYRLSAMDAIPGSAQNYGILNDSRGNQGQFGPRYLATLDIQSGTISIIGQTADGMDSIAVRNDMTPIPSLSGFGSVILAIILLSASVLVIRRGRKISV